MHGSSRNFLETETETTNPAVRSIHRNKEPHAQIFKTELQNLFHTTLHLCEQFHITRKCFFFFLLQQAASSVQLVFLFCNFRQGLTSNDRRISVTRKSQLCDKAEGAFARDTERSSSLQSGRRKGGKLLCISRSRYAIIKTFPLFFNCRRTLGGQQCF